MMRSIRRHIVHCSDSPTGDVKAIRQWHHERGWDDVGYHFIIRRDGEIEVGRTLDCVGAHCVGYNVDSVGTCLVGRDTFTAEQIRALQRIHGMLICMFGPLDLCGHRELNATGKTCPNFDVHKAIGA